eukprot:CAMPEP_0183710290 /NCGR_PEP_ID=MMETSP0737-20130205/6060_1 /TAXON_ID=385413 /ORGANISM="Thalassiosira miniscula, Strain CCMP1093" /LENGTH=230 /DNA_ID=CAMNT_0025938525 /DNA_START=238 /DNA_END=930 /DNA_ORIENTATION=+
MQISSAYAPPAASIRLAHRRPLSVVASASGGHPFSEEELVDRACEHAANPDDLSEDFVSRSLEISPLASIGGYSKYSGSRRTITAQLPSRRRRRQTCGIAGAGTVVDRRRLIALLPPIAVASFVPTAVANCKPNAALLDARMQLDLAVQASQAWDDAAEIANDPLLDEDNLLRALESCQDPSRDRVTATVLESVRKMRDIVAKEGKTTEDAMTFMKFGTSARTAVDSYLE